MVDVRRTTRIVPALLTALAVLAPGCNENELNPLSPDVFVSPEEVDFGTVTVGVLSTQLLTVHNVGGATLTVDSVTMDEPDGPFSVGPYEGELSADDAVELTVRFEPVELGPAEGLILVESDDPDEPVVEVPVFAVDVVEAPTPAIAWSPTALDWGAVPSGGEVAQAVTLTSVGTADLEITAVTLDGASSGDFVVTVDPSPATLPPTHTTQVEVVYAPSDEIPDTGTLVISCNDPDTPEVNIPLSGELQPAPDIELVPPQLQFGEVPLGSSVTMEAELWSLGDVELQLGTLIQTGSPEFVLHNDPSQATVPVGVSIALPVTYTPTDMNPDTAQIEIPSDDPDEPVVVLTLVGQHEPIPDIDVDPLQIDFGLHDVGTTTTDTVAVSNVGTGDLVVSAPVLTGSLDFSLAAAQFPTAIPPGGTELLVVTYAPSDLIDDTGEIRIPSDDPDEPEVLVTLSGAPMPAPDIDVDPPALAFGQVMVGDTLSLTSTVSNVGTEDLVLGSLSVNGTSEFAITVDPGGLTLGPGDATPLEVTYSPIDAGSDTAVVEIPSNDPDEDPTFVALDGSELPVPDIDVDPTFVDFGQVDIGLSSTYPVQVRNIGATALDVTSLTAGGSGDFGYTSLNLPGTVAPGGQVTVYVSYDPSDDVDDVGTLTFASNDPDEPSVVVDLVGEPTPYPDIDADPWTVDFGDVQVNTTAYETVTLLNVGDADLEIYNAHVGGDPSFFLSVNPNGAVVPPGGSTQLEVGFDPNAEGNYIGWVEVPSNDPDEPLVTIDLIADGTDPAIELDPAMYLFGQVMAGCEETVDVAVRSVGTAPLTLYSYHYDVTPYPTMTADTATLDSYVASGWTLPPGDEITVTVSFIPDDIVQFEGTLTVESDDHAQPLAQASQYGTGDAGGWHQDQFVQQGNNWADVLWVVDNSCSMGDEQGQLADDFSYFYGIINSAGVDYHIAVVTTDDEDFQGAQKVIYPTTPNGGNTFAANCTVGTGGSATERGIKFGYDGLVKARNQQAPNTSFWRDDAGLRLVYVSDEADQSGSWSNYLSSYQAMKANPDHVIMSAICGTDGYGATSCSGQGGSADAGTGYVDIANATGGVLGRICDSSWSTALTNLAWITVNLADTFPLTYPAIPNTIDVSVNGTQALGGWSYDAGLNAVVFDPAHVPDDGDYVQVDYAYFGNC